MKYFLLLLMACSNSSKLDPKVNHAMDFAAMIPEKITGKCAPWESDSVLCRMSDTSILWCSAPKGGKPHCEVAADWSPKPPEPPKETPEVTSPPAKESKKK